MTNQVEHAKLSTPKIIYTPEGQNISGYFKLFKTTRSMFAELMLSRELILILFLRDFKARYRQSLLGVIWIFLMPLLTVGMFVGMSRTGVLSIREVGLPYPLYALTGFTVWSVFTVGLTACSGALVNAGNMIAKINFPKISLVLAAFGQSLVEFSVRLIIIATACIYYGVFPDLIGLLFFLISLIPICSLTLGLGFIFALVAGVVRDILNALGILLLVGMLITPVLYPLDGSSLLAVVNRWNPLNYLVTVPRDLLFLDHSFNMSGFFWSSLFSLLFLFLGWRLFFLAQPKIAERI